MATLIAVLWLALGILAQVIFFNHLSLLGGVALVYVYLLLRVPVETNRLLQIVLGFVVGMTVDMFCNTPGMHALAAVTTMFVRVPVVHLYVPADDFKSGTPSLQTMGMTAFSRYALTIIILHCIILYVAEAFTLFNFWTLLLKVVISIVLTYLLAIVIEIAIQKRR